MPTGFPPTYAQRARRTETAPERRAVRVAGRYGSGLAAGVCGGVLPPLRRESPAHGAQGIWRAAGVVAAVGAAGLGAGEALEA